MLKSTAFSGILLLTAAVADRPRSQPASAPSPTCQAITAHVTAAAGRPTPTLAGLRIRGAGTSRGDLTGSVTVDVNKPYIGKNLDVVLRIVSQRGELVARGTATARRDTAASSTHSIRTSTEVGPGRGAFAESHGEVIGRGRVNTNTRVIDITLTGVVCADWASPAGAA